MNKELKELFGGYDKLAGSPKKLTISGGFTKDNKHIEHKIIIGDLAKNFVKNKIIEWDAFKSAYYKKGKINKKYYNQFINAINDIFPLPIHTTDEDELLFLVSNIYKTNPNEIITALMKSVNIISSLKSAIRHLFMVYKVYLERMIEIYINLRNGYITKFNLQKNNNLINFDEITARWNIIDTKNDIDTSSPILFFSFHPSTIKFEKTIPKLKWDIKSTNIKHKKINRKAGEFLDEIKNRKFVYVGYCPHIAIDRFKSLLKFPINNLIEMIKLIDYDNEYSCIDKKCTLITRKVVELSSKVSEIHTKDKSLVCMKDIEVKVLQEFPKNTKISKKIKYFEQYVDAFIQLYKDLIPRLIEKEKYINNLAIDINKIAEDLQLLSNSF
jgi:hypothetical protein